MLSQAKQKLREIRKLTGADAFRIPPETSSSESNNKLPPKMQFKVRVPNVMERPSEQTEVFFINKQASLWLGEIYFCPGVFQRSPGKFCAWAMPFQTCSLCVPVTNHRCCIHVKALATLSAFCGAFRGVVFLHLYVSIVVATPNAFALPHCGAASCFARCQFFCCGRGNVPRWCGQAFSVC